MDLPSVGEVAQLITALSAVWAAGSSWINRVKINKVTLKVEQAVIQVAATKEETTTKAEEVKQVIHEAKDEVKEAIKNGKNGHA